jgi:hypothetical protein
MSAKRTMRAASETLRRSAFHTHVPSRTPVNSLLVVVVTTGAGPLERVILRFLLGFGHRAVLLANAGIMYLFPRLQNLGNDSAADFV